MGIGNFQVQISNIMELFPNILRVVQYNLINLMTLEVKKSIRNYVGDAIIIRLANLNNAINAHLDLILP